MGRTCAGEVIEELSLMGQGKSATNPPAEGAGAAESTCYDLTVAPIPHPPALLEGRRLRIQE